MCAHVHKWRTGVEAADQKLLWENANWKQEKNHWSADLARPRAGPHMTLSRTPHSLRSLRLKPEGKSGDSTRPLIFSFLRWVWRRGDDLTDSETIRVTTSREVSSLRHSCSSHLSSQDLGEHLQDVLATAVTSCSMTHAASERLSHILCSFPERQKLRLTPVSTAVLP